MSSRLIRLWLMPLFLLASQAWALGLGEIRLSSALNEPLRAEIELLAAAPEELENLRIQLASAETFERYDLDRPLFLTGLRFQIVRSGRTDGNYVRVTSAEPVTEPFITFLVEAAWSRGRLLREYTVLLDPPTFAPPPTTQSTQPVTAPTRQAPADSGEIRRPAPTPQPEPAPSPRQAVQPPVQTPPAQSEPTRAQPQPAAEQPPAQPQPAAEQPPVRPAPAETPDTLGEPGFDSTSGREIVVRRGDTLWGITQRVRPDSRLTINQTMLAIFEANPEAFNGNINFLRAGATLRIPGADDIFRISRRDAFQEVQRQNNEWRGGAALAAPTVEPADTAPSLTLVPPDEEELPAPTDSTADTAAEDVIEPQPADEVVDPVEERIRELEGILEDQDALIEIPDTELAALRNELAQLRGEPLPVEEPPADDLQIEDEQAATTGEPAAEPAEPVVRPPVAVVTTRQPEEGLIDKAVGIVTNFWFIIGAAFVIAVLVLVWFSRRAGRDDEDMTGVWEALDEDEQGADSMVFPERRGVPPRDDEAIVVVEPEEEGEEMGGDTVLRPIREPDSTQEIPVSASDSFSDSGMHKSLDDTFSSDTAINLDQADPIAEADFHMAYGLYDQAADLISDSLKADPKNQTLLSKLCEIYFVWGNRDGFVDAATRLKARLGDSADADWDKIVIMGQQIAGDHELFSGVSAGGATRAVDLSLDDGADGGAELDIDFAQAPDEATAEIFDLGAGNDELAIDETGQVPIPTDTGTGIDFDLGGDDDFDDTSATRDMAEPTVDSPTIEAPAEDRPPTVETPTIEEQFAAESTSVIPAIDDGDQLRAVDEVPEAEATAEIDLDDLDLDLEGMNETAARADDGDDSAFDEMLELRDLDDSAESVVLATDEDSDELATTGANQEIEDVDILAVSATREMPMSDESREESGKAADDTLAETGRNPEMDFDDLDATSTGEIPAVDDETAATGLMAALGDTESDDDGDATGLLPAIGDDDEATERVQFDDGEDSDVGMDTSLLDATGHTQVLSDDMAVESYRDADQEVTDDEDDGEFKFSKTEGFSKDVFGSDTSADETDETQGLVGSTDLDLDLGDLTAALQVSEVGDTINVSRDDATVEQPRMPPEDDESSEADFPPPLHPEDLSGDLHDARTMTEVGTKLDLARAYVDMGDPEGARSILEEVLDEGDAAQMQQARQLLETLPG